MVASPAPVPSAAVTRSSPPPLTKSVVAKQPASNAPVTEAAPSKSWHRRGLAIAHLTVGIAALVGGITLVVHPSGNKLGLTVNDLRAFSSYSTPGLLLIIFAWVQIGAAILVTRPGAHGLLVSQIAGGLLMLWSAFQAALVVPLHPLQLVSLLGGVAIYTVAHEMHRIEPHESWLP
jgi:hypothetical protein